MTLRMSNPAAQRRFEAHNALAADHNYNYHHQKPGVDDPPEINPTTPKPIGDDYKQQRFDLMPYAQAANQSPLFRYAQDIWKVNPGVITNALHCLGYHRTVQIFTMVQGMADYRFNKGKCASLAENRGAYFRTCCKNEAVRLGKIWDANDRKQAGQ